MAKVKMQQMIVDPPSGWQYGFPKVFDLVYSGDESKAEAERNAWFVANGYPQRDVDAGMLKYCRSWVKEIEIEIPDDKVDNE